MNDLTKERIKPASIRKTLKVRAPIDRAFGVFTRRMGQWWSKDFSINRSTLQKDVVIEPRVGGRWYEIGEDGLECPWGRVLEWDEPNAVKLAWQINADWNYDPSFETVVDVRFAEREGVTVVTFEHSDLERFGAALARQFQQMDGGWSMLLEGFKSAADSD